MTPDCERFEIEIGMRQHGALDAREEAQLEAHLAGCLACRQFAATSGDLDVSLRRRAEADVSQVDWEKLQHGVHRLRRSYRRKLWLAPIFLLQLPLSFLLAKGTLPPPEMLAVVPFVTVGIYLAYVWLVNRPFREVMAVVKSSDDLLHGYVCELRRQRLRARLFVVLNVSLTLFSLGTVVFGPTGRVQVYGFAMAGLFGYWAAWDLMVKLPRLRRALGEVTR